MGDRTRVSRGLLGGFSAAAVFARTGEDACLLEIDHRSKYKARARAVYTRTCLRVSGGGTKCMTDMKDMLELREVHLCVFQHRHYVERSGLTMLWPIVYVPTPARLLAPTSVHQIYRCRGRARARSRRL